MHKVIICSIAFLLTPIVVRAEKPSIMEIRSQFEQAVMDTLGKSYQEMDTSEVLSKLADIAEHVYSPHISTLNEEALRQSQGLAMYDDGKLSRFSRNMQVKEEHIHASINLYSDIVARPYLTEGWSPTETAKRVKQAVIVRSMSAEDVGRRTVLEKFIPDKYFRQNIEYEDLVIIIESLGELFILSLELSNKGIYVPKKLEWLIGTP